MRGQVIRGFYILGNLHLVISSFYSCGKFTLGTTSGSSDCEIYVCCNDGANMLQQHVSSRECRLTSSGRLQKVKNRKLQTVISKSGCSRSQEVVAHERIWFRKLLVFGKSGRLWEVFAKGGSSVWKKCYLACQVLRGESNVHETRGRTQSMKIPFHLSRDPLSSRAPGSLRSLSSACRARWKWRTVDFWFDTVKYCSHSGRLAFCILNVL